VFVIKRRRGESLSHRGTVQSNGRSRPRLRNGIGSVLAADISGMRGEWPFFASRTWIRVWQSTWGSKDGVGQRLKKPNRIKT